MPNNPEDQIQKQYTWLDVPKSFWYFLGKNKFKWVFFNILLFTIFTYDFLPPYILGKIVDFFTKYKPGDSLNTFYFYAFFIGTTSIIVAIIRLTSKNRLNRIAISTKTTARIEGFEKLMDHSLSWHSKENSGNKVQRIFNGSQSISEWTTLINQGIFPVANAFIGVIIIFIFLSPVFLIFCATYSIIYLLIENHFNKKIEKLSDELNALRENSSGKYIESSGNILAIKALGAEKGIHKNIVLCEEITKKHEIIRSNTGTRKWYLFQTLNGISLIVFLFLIANQYISGIISIGLILTYYYYYNDLRQATDRLTDISIKVVQLKSDLFRMMPIFNEKSQIKTGTENFPKDWDNIAFSNCFYNYPSSKSGLDNLNFVIKKNEKIGIAGESGSAKSTLVKILLGLHKIEHGSINIGNKDYYKIAHEKIMKNISVVLQDSELFNLSLKDNITMMREIDGKLLEKSIEIACLNDLIKRLPNGLETLIGEKGYSLSGGERQRIGIARAIYKNSPILILDEATSSLDSKTEEKIISKLFSEFGKNKTFLIIAHRISTLRDTDRVIVFEKGSIIEEGNYYNLIKNNKTHLGQLYFLQNKLK